MFGWFLVSVRLVFGWSLVGLWLVFGFSLVGLLVASLVGRWLFLVVLLFVFG